MKERPKLKKKEKDICKYRKERYNKKEKHSAREKDKRKRKKKDILRFQH